MSPDSATDVGVQADADHGEGRVVFRWAHDRYGHEQLTIGLDGHCSRRMPLRAGNGLPEIVELRRDGIRIRFDPALARRLGWEEEIEILFRLPDAEFDELRRAVDHLAGPCA